MTCTLLTALHHMFNSQKYKSLPMLFTGNSICKHTSAYLGMIHTNNIHHLECKTLPFAPVCRRKNAPLPPRWSLHCADPPSPSPPPQATPSPPSRRPARTWWCRWALPSSCSAAAPRPCSGSGRSGPRCAARGRWTACPRSTFPGLSRRTWAATSAWRRAHRREPTSTST